MTNTERNLERRVFLNGEEAAWLADKIVTGSPEYCNDAARFLRKYSEMEQQLSIANAAIAMKDEALKEAIELIDTDTCTEFPHELEMIHKALSTSPESIAAWEAEKLERENGTTSNKYRAELYDEVWNKARSMGFANVTDALDTVEPLRKQVAMLIAAINRNYGEFLDDEVRAGDALKNLACAAVDTQATAEAYDREHAAKVLEDAGWKMGEEARTVLFEIASELRAANKNE